jgi:hypothetical protein
VPTHTGLAFGPGNLWRDSARLRWGPGPFNASYNYSDPDWLVQELEVARRKNLRVIINMTGGKHSRYKTNDKFDPAKWRARMDQYDTREIKAAVARGVADGTIIMNSVMDEPNVKSWGGVVTKPMLDDMASYVKKIFPTLPVGVALRWDWKQEERFRVMDVILTMYAWNKGDIDEYREGALAIARRDGMAVAFALNVLNGGEYSGKTKACPIPLTGGHGTYSPACKMTASQVRNWGLTLGPHGCAMSLWEFDEEFMTKPDNMQAFKDIAAELAKIPPRSCRRK